MGRRRSAPTIRASRRRSRTRKRARSCSTASTARTSPPCCRVTATTSAAPRRPRGSAAAFCTTCCARPPAKHPSERSQNRACSCLNGSIQKGHLMRFLLAAVPLLLSSIVAAEPAAMSKNKAVVKRFEEEFKNKANHAIVDDLMAPTYNAHGLGPIPMDREGLKPLGKGVVAAFPDVHVDVQSLVAEGDIVVTRCLVKGTHKGPFNGIPPTAKKIEFTEMHMYQLRDGKIIEQWSNVDFLAILTQIGAVPP